VYAAFRDQVAKKPLIAPRPKRGGGGQIFFIPIRTPVTRGCADGEARRGGELKLVRRGEGEKGGKIRSLENLNGQSSLKKGGQGENPARMSNLRTHSRHLEKKEKRGANPGRDGGCDREDNDCIEKCRGGGD